HVVEAADVRFVERRVDLVEETEWRRPDEEERQDQRHGRERLLPTGEQAQRLELLPGGLDDNLEPRLAALLGLGELEPRAALGEELREYLLEALVGRDERLFEALAGRPDE